MRRTLGIAVKAGIGQLVVVAMTFFAESLYPLGDCRWLAIAVGGIAVLAVWVFLDWYRGRDEREHAKAKKQADKASHFWERKEARHKTSELEAFWQSPAGKFIHEVPIFEDDSLEIFDLATQSEQDQRPRELGLGTYSVQIDEHRVAVVQMVPKSKLRRWWGKRKKRGLST